MIALTRLGFLVAALLLSLLRPATIFSPESPAPTDSLTHAVGPYVWPTNASTKVTSAFAEYRSTHFHGGIDISTNGVKGYNVFAVNDGSVYKVRITPNGYGKMLFIRHPDGYISTYAHLQGFNEAITQAVRKEQYRRGTYAVDLTLPPDAIRVHRGDVVAYTGDSGFGPPHLHFELRDRDLNPVNPFLVAHYAVDDGIPPQIRRVLLSPLTYTSTIDNSPKPRILGRFPRRKDGLTIPQQYLFHGMIGIGIEAQDKMDGTWSKAGIYGLRFFIDDSLAFAMNLDHVPADETKEIDLHYDFRTILQGWGKFQKLYIDLGNTLTFYHQMKEGSGIINTERLPEGAHTYAIVCSDFTGNETTLRGRFLVNHSPVVSTIAVAGGQVRVRGTHLDLAARYLVAGKKFGSQSWSERIVTRPESTAGDTAATLPFEPGKFDVVRVVAESKWKSRTAPAFAFLATPAGDARKVYCKTEVFTNYVRCTVTSTGIFTGTPALKLQEGTSTRVIAMTPADLYTFTATFTPSPMFAGERQITVTGLVNGRPVTAADAFTLWSIPAGSRGSFTTDDEHLRISYDSGAVFVPLHMQVSSEDFKQSRVYILEPQDQLLNGGLRVSVPVDPGRDREGLGLYFRANGGWIFQTGKPDSGGRTYSTTLTRTLGELTLMTDLQPPSIGRLRVSARKGLISMAFRYHDNLSGVDADEIKVYIDGKLVIPEIDGEHRSVTVTSDSRYEKGKHAVMITAKDRMGNATSVSRTVSVR